VGLPFTSAPVAFFVALDRGAAFAATTALNTLAGTLSQVAFCLAYAWLAVPGSWPLAILAGSLGFAAATAALQHLTLPPPAVFLMVIATLVVAQRLLPRGGGRRAPAGRLPRWDLPARMAVATGVVLVLTGLAPTLGPRLTGLLTGFPLYAGTLAVFAHQQRGPRAAERVLRGLLLGLFGFAGFFFVLTTLIGRAGLVRAFLAALAVALACQGVSLWVLRRRAAASESAA
jgi:uncharacterized membrane protein (GlpM family)